jgi:hypothetical protein
VCRSTASVEAARLLSRGISGVACVASLGAVLALLVVGVLVVLWGGFK